MSNINQELSANSRLKERWNSDWSSERKVQFQIDLNNCSLIRLRGEPDSPENNRLTSIALENLKSARTEV
jgi:hypothetical protein